ncbi:MAG TPA: Panacea domain-containing protein [Magnetospirillaceae bacterium]|jgi:uncharacterized phage-associated protein
MRGFKVRKAAQVVAYFAIAEGGSINVLKLIKLIYLSDRRFIEKYDCPILNDRFVSMPRGPVNSMTLNYVSGIAGDRDEWKKFISDRAKHSVGVANSRIKKSDLDELSKAEKKVLAEIWDRFGERDGFWLEEYTHKHCPEWEDPDGSSEPIPYERILKFLKKKNVARISANLEAERELDRSLATAIS